jgi:hypothetical protein
MNVWGSLAYSPLLLHSTLFFSPSSFSLLLLLSVQNLTIDNLNIPEELKKNLFPFQRDGVEFVVRREGRALIGLFAVCMLTSAMSSSFPFPVLLLFR